MTNETYLSLIFDFWPFIFHSNKKLIVILFLTKKNVSSFCTIMASSPYMMHGWTGWHIRQQMLREQQSPTSLDALSFTAARCQSYWHLELHSLCVFTIKTRILSKPLHSFKQNNGPQRCLVLRSLLIIHVSTTAFFVIERGIGAAFMGFIGTVADAARKKQIVLHD